MTLTYQFRGGLGDEVLAQPCFCLLLRITEVNVNLATTYTCKQEQMNQIEFCKVLVKTLIYNNHYNEENNETPDKERKKQETSHCSPYEKNFQGCKSFKSTTCKKGYVPIVFVPKPMGKMLYYRNNGNCY